MATETFRLKVCNGKYEYVRQPGFRAVAQPQPKE